MLTGSTVVRYNVQDYKYNFYLEMPGEARS